MRTPADYPPPKYSDPDDLRLTRLIESADRSAPRAVNILGVPFDGAVLGRRGAAEGPAAVRLAMSGFSNYCVELGLGLTGSRIFDLGDISFHDGEDVVSAHETVEKEVAEGVREGSLLVLVGGDNSVSLPALRAMSKRYGEVGLVVIDSHFDLRGRIGGKPTSGSSYGLAIEEAGLDPHRVAEIGIHGFLNSEAYARKAERLGVSVFTASDVREKGPRGIAREAYRVAAKGARAVYLSVDLDAVDLAQVSGVSAPSVGGITPNELCEIVFRVSSGDKLVAADIVELAPKLDPTGRSQIVAATTLVYMAAGFKGRKGTGNTK